MRHTVVVHLTVESDSADEAVSVVNNAIKNVDLELFHIDSAKVLDVMEDDED